MATRKFTPVWYLTTDDQPRIRTASWKTRVKRSRDRLVLKAEAVVLWERRR